MRYINLHLHYIYIIMVISGAILADSMLVKVVTTLSIYI